MLENKIAELRKEKNLSQEQLAEILNTSRQAVSKWERGEAYPDIDRLKELAIYFGAYLFDEFVTNYRFSLISSGPFACARATKPCLLRIHFR